MQFGDRWRQWIVVDAGVFLIVSAVVYQYLDGDDLLTESAEMALPILAGVGIVALGVHLRRHDRYSTRDVWQVAAGTVAGGLAFVFVIGWILVVMRIESGLPQEIGYIFLNGIAIGMLGGAGLTILHTRLQRERAKHRESEQRYESLYSSMRDAVLVADTNRRIVDCNPAFTDLFGYPLEEIEGNETKFVYESEEEFERLGAALRNHEAGRQFVMTVNYQKRSGDVFPGETTAFPLRDDTGTTIGFVGLIRDVSDRVERTRQLQVMDRVLRHNVSNTMNVILGHAQSIEADADPATRDHVAHIVESGNDLVTMAAKQRRIVKLLSESRTRMPYDLSHGLDALADDLRSAYPDSQVDVAVPDGLCVHAIPEIDTAFAELGENALEHNESTPPVVRYRAENTGGTVRVVVEDNGPGIPDDEIGVLTGQRDIEPLYHGSGLGLWLVYHAVKQSNGNLAFEENESGGSTITIELPVARAE